MTSGNTSFGGMTPTYTGCGQGSTGASSSRQWSGTDGRSKENPYSATFTVAREPIIRWGGSFQNTGTVSSCYGGVYFDPPDANAMSALKNRVLKGLLGKYKQHDFNAAIFLGELPETVQTIVKPCVTTLRAYSLVRKGRFSKAVKLLKSERGPFKIDKQASNNWLALRYGWLPMIGDAYAAADAYQTLRKDKPVQYVRIRSKAQIKPVAQSLMRFQTEVGRMSKSIVLKTGFKMSIPDSLGLSNPALLAWELLPFSFVVDWVYDIGSWLELVTTLPSGAGSTYIETDFWVSDVRGPILGRRVNPDPKEKFRDTDTYRRTTVTVNRSISTAPGIPPPRLKNPFNGSLTRLADALALARALT